MNAARKFYEKQARELIRELREQKQISFVELQRRLQAHGVRLELQALINKVNRGTYSFSFALQVLAAMDVKLLLLPNAHRRDGLLVNAMVSTAHHLASEAPERPNDDTKHLK